MDTHESYVNQNVAKMLKQAGFDWETTYVYENGEIVVGEIFRTKEVALAEFPAPTLAVAQRWLREIKHCHCYAMRDYGDEDKPEHCAIYGYEGPDTDLQFIMKNKNDRMLYKTYEDALAASIGMCLIHLTGHLEYNEYPETSKQ